MSDQPGGEEHLISRQKRWDRAFSEDMTDTVVAQLLEREPFASIVREKAAGGERALQPLIDILRNEARKASYAENEIILRQGDHGSSVFIVLEGRVLVLFNLQSEWLGQSRQKRHSFFTALSQLWRNSALAETRDISRYTQQIQIEGQAYKERSFLKNAAKIVTQLKLPPVGIGQGGIFGEVAALRRSQRTATVMAAEATEVVEIRWQGLRDLMAGSAWFKQFTDELYRRRSLRSHLLAMPLFQNLPEEQLENVIKQAVFESHGKQDWNFSFKKLDDLSLDDRIKDEPMIVEEGDYANGLILLRSGFARVSKKYHRKQRTVDYMRRGDIIGLNVLTHNALHADKRPYEFTVRAIGYADVIRIPASTFELHIFPFIGNKKFQQEQLRNIANLTDNVSLTDAVLNRESALLEFFVERRFINGTKTMLINTERCTQCDDCVRACSAAHDNNPRFIRHGHRIGKFMVANACMHCFDPVCMIGCPTGAIARNPAGGEIVINDDVCIGCATCANSCPYNNIRMVHVYTRSGELVMDKQFMPITKATKCDLCYQQKVTPSCEQACPHGALRRVDIHDMHRIKDWLQT